MLCQVDAVKTVAATHVEKAAALHRRAVFDRKDEALIHLAAENLIQESRELRLAARVNLLEGAGLAVPELPLHLHLVLHHPTPSLMVVNWKSLSSESNRFSVLSELPSCRNAFDL